MSRASLAFVALLFIAAGLAFKNWFGSGESVDGEASKTEAALLMKIWDADCAPMKAGQQYEMAQVDSMSLCASIARAYNFARTADRPERAEEFGVCWDKYSFHCMKK